ncbi:MAG: DUF6678 family protein [Carboxydocellales bacterium]
MGSTNNHSVMNKTKWEEIRMAMYNFPQTIRWRTKDINNDHISDWDAEWFYHFQLGGYETIEWLEIEVNNELVKSEILNILRKIHVPGKVEDISIFIFGYQTSSDINYI